MRGWPVQLIGGLWLLWALYWIIAAFGTKPTREREVSWLRRVPLLALLFGALLVGARRAHGWLSMAVIPGGWFRYWAAVVLVVAGLGFAIWARVALAGNWSGFVTVKEGHELIQHGPYRHLRHPIYSGLLLAILGSALAGGQVRVFVVFVIALIGFFVKSRAEERLMEREFGERYTAYRASTWALIPFVL
jgi:protein-S-isoprenylcysteine O-methyltransferase Ste14